jgi:hypothetical protein
MGYDLVPGAMGKATEEVYPRGVLVGSRQLQSGLELARYDLQASLVKALLSLRRRDRIVVRRTAGSRVAVFSPAWNVKYNDGCCIEGETLLSLVTELYGVSAGIAAVRVLEAATGARLDAPAVLGVQVAVDAWVARGAPRNEGRRS